MIKGHLSVWKINGVLDDNHWCVIQTWQVYCKWLFLTMVSAIQPWPSATSSADLWESPRPTFLPLFIGIFVLFTRCMFTKLLESCLILLMILHSNTIFVNWGHLKKITAPWLKKLVEYSYLFPKYSETISREKKMGVFFLFHFFVKGVFYM